MKTLTFKSLLFCVSVVLSACASDNTTSTNKLRGDSAQTSSGDTQDTESSLRSGFDQNINANLISIPLDVHTDFGYIYKNHFIRLYAYQDVENEGVLFGLVTDSEYGAGARFPVFALGSGVIGFDLFAKQKMEKELKDIHNQEGEYIDWAAVRIKDLPEELPLVFGWTAGRELVDGKPLGVAYIKETHKFKRVD